LKFPEFSQSTLKLWYEELWLCTLTVRLLTTDVTVTLLVMDIGNDVGDPEQLWVS
jgi:hypothetical protein